MSCGVYIFVRNSSLFVFGSFTACLLVFAYNSYIDFGKENFAMSEDNKKLTADQLENIAGGKIASGPKCPKCDIYLDWDGGLGAHKCPACGYYDPSEIDGWQVIKEL
jgi:hypothetical protein